MQALILCGGLSTRLGDLTKTKPKILLEIAGKTVLQHQVELLAEAGAEEVFLASGHLHEVLQEAVGDSLQGVPIHYVREGKPLGTGGAIKNGLSQMQRWPIFVLNGDILLDTSLAQMREQMQGGWDGILLGVHVEDGRSYGRLITDPQTHQIKQFVEKDPHYEGSGFINGGVYLFQETIKAYFPEQEKFSIEYDVFPFVKSLFMHPYTGTWIDIGTPERLDFARQHLGHVLHRGPK